MDQLESRAVQATNSGPRREVGVGSAAARNSQARRLANASYTEHLFDDVVETLAPLVFSGEATTANILLYESALSQSGHDEEGIAVLLQTSPQDADAERVQTRLSSRFAALTARRRREDGSEAAFDVLKRWCAAQPASARAAADLGLAALGLRRLDEVAPTIVAAANAAPGHPTLGWLAALLEMKRISPAAALQRLGEATGPLHNLRLIALGASRKGRVSLASNDASDLQHMALQVERDLEHAGLAEEATTFLRFCLDNTDADGQILAQLARLSLLETGSSDARGGKRPENLAQTTVYPPTVGPLDNPFQAQISTSTYPARHDHIFKATARVLREAEQKAPRLLSFGCSTGFEPLDLRRLLPEATVLGCEIDLAALQAARTLCSPHGIEIFLSTPAALASKGPFDAVFAMNVLALYPAVQGQDNISEIFPIGRFDALVSLIADQVRVGGYVAVYNSCYPFELSTVGPLFEAVPLQPIFKNGWIDKYDRKGRRLTEARGYIDGEPLPIGEWRRAIQKLDPMNTERASYRHKLLRKNEAPDLTTILWRRTAASGGPDKGPRSVAP